MEERLVTALSERRYIRLVTERTVEQFLLRLFLRDVKVRNLSIVSPFISTLDGSRFSLRDLSEKIRRERIPTYVVTRSPTERYQEAAMAILATNEWVEVRFNESVHAKVYVSSAIPESGMVRLLQVDYLDSSGKARDGARLSNLASIDNFAPGLLAKPAAGVGLSNLNNPHLRVVHPKSSDQLNACTAR